MLSSQAHGNTGHSSHLKLLLGISLPIVVVLALRRLASKGPMAPETDQSTTRSISEARKPFGDETPWYGEVVPRPGFDWERMPRLRIWPFRPQYHLRMALEKIAASELVEIDCTYLEQINLRRSIMRSNSDEVLGADIMVEPSVRELYVWLVSEYLPQRYPSIFTLTGSYGSPCEPQMIRNIITDEFFDLVPPKTGVAALQVLGSIIDEDMMILLPAPDGDGYIMRGFVNCYANGSSTKARMMRKLRDIHGGIPGYQDQIGTRMDSYFDRLQVGIFVKRANWTITDTPSLFSPVLHRPFDGRPDDDGTLDMKNIFLRCERQTLYRLPSTKAIVFSVKTYQYPVAEVKDAGLGEELAQAIDGLRSSSVPGIDQYKRENVWGKAVKAYLLS